MQVTCIVCPNGCALDIEKDGENIKVSGNKCPRGKDFAIKELTFPTRSVTTTVKTVFEEMPVLPVRTNGEIPKDKMFDFIDEVKKITLRQKIKVGEVVIKNVLDLGVDVIATGSIL